MSLQNVIEQLTVNAEPEPERVLSISFEIATLWTRAETDVPSQGSARITFLSPSGRSLRGTEHPINLSETVRVRSSVHFQGLPIGDEPGRHLFRMELQNEGETEWRQVAAIPVQIVYVPQESEQAIIEPE